MYDIFVIFCWQEPFFGVSGRCLLYCYTRNSGKRQAFSKIDFCAKKGGIFGCGFTVFLHMDAFYLYVLEWTRAGLVCFFWVSWVRDGDFRKRGLWRLIFRPLAICTHIEYHPGIRGNGARHVHYGWERALRCSNILQRVVLFPLLHIVVFIRGYGFCMAFFVWGRGSGRASSDPYSLPIQIFFLFRYFAYSDILHNFYIQRMLCALYFYMPGIRLVIFNFIYLQAQLQA
jgi:hypothetical protein